MISFEERKKTAIKIPKKIKEAYNVLGTIRDLQLQQLNISALSKTEPLNYQKSLRKRVSKLESQFLKLFFKDPVTASKKKTIDPIRNELSIHMFEDYMYRKRTAIKTIIAAGLSSDNDIHTIRKILKDVFYNMEIFEKVENILLASIQWKGNEKDNLDKLLDELGDFQDKCTAITLLGAYWLKNLDDYELQFLQHTKEIWIGDRSVMKQALINKLQTGPAHNLFYHT